MSTSSYLQNMINDVNSYLPANKGIRVTRFPLDKGYGYAYVLYSCLYSSVDRKTVISESELTAGPLKDCKLYLEAMKTTLSMLNIKKV